MELHRSNQSMKHEIIECSNASNNMKGLLAMRQQRHELSDCMNLNNSGVATVINGTHQVPINCVTSSHTNSHSQSSAATISPSSSSNGAAATKMGSRRIFTPQFKLQVLDSYRNDNDCKGNQRATARKYGIHRRQIQKWLQCETNLRTSVLNSNNNNKNMLQNMLCNSAPAPPPSNADSLNLSKPSAKNPSMHPYGGTQPSPSNSGDSYMLMPLDGNNAINANSPKPATPLMEYLHRYPSGVVAAGNSQCSTTGLATTTYPALVHTSEHAPVSHQLHTLEATAAFSACAAKSPSTSLSCSPRHDHGGCMRQEDSDNSRLTSSRGVDYCGTHNRCGNLYLYENPIDLTLKWRKRSELDDARIPTPHNACPWQSHHHRHNVCAITHELSTAAAVAAATTPSTDPNVLDLSCNKRKAEEMTPERSLCTRKQPLQLLINDNNNLAPKPVKLFKPYLPSNGDEDSDEEEQDDSKKNLSKNDQRDPIIWSNHPSCCCVGGDATAMHFNELTSPLSQTSYSSLSPPLSSYPMSDSGASSMNSWSGSSWSASSSSSSSFSSAYGSGCESSDASPPPSPYLNCQYSVMFKVQAIDTYYTDEMCRGDERAVADKFNVHQREIEEWLSQEEDLRQRLVVQL